jgi:hypothetical protein
MDDLLGRPFRANPAYELVLWDRLEPAERASLERLREDPELYGVLRPRGDGAMAEGAPGLKAVDRETALLFLTLREPGGLPSYVRELLGAAAGRTIGRLVADGVLEVEREGAFVHGAAAFEPGLAGGEENGGGHLAALSLAALRYGAALAVDDPLRLSFRLYGYNRRPLTPRWQRRLAGAAAVEGFLGIAPGGANRQRLDAAWLPAPPSAAWLSWRSRREETAENAPADGGATFKLYVSPAPEALAGSFGAILDALAAARAPQLKVGAGAAGLLRPDKIVAYFPSFERLAAAAEAMTPRLAGIAAQGVPFTSEIGGGGLLSWGMDPPPTAGQSWNGPMSWRLWLTHRLARALLSARRSPDEAAAPEPWRFALERVRLEGVDTATWTPASGLWSEG